MNKKRFFKYLILSLVIFGISIPVIASSYDDPPTPYAMVFLPANEMGKSTKAMRGTYKIFNGVNYSTSIREVSFRAQYFNEKIGEWQTTVTRHLKPNTILGDTSTSRLADGLWRLNVSNRYFLKGGVARGNMWYAQ